MHLTPLQNTPTIQVIKGVVGQTHVVEAGGLDRSVRRHGTGSRRTGRSRHRPGCAGAPAVPAAAENADSLCINILIML